MPAGVLRYRSASQDEAQDGEVTQHSEMPADRHKSIGQRLLPIVETIGVCFFIPHDGERKWTIICIETRSSRDLDFLHECQSRGRDEHA